MGQAGQGLSSGAIRNSDATRKIIVRRSPQPQHRGDDPVRTFTGAKRGGSVQQSAQGKGPKEKGQK